MTQRCLLVFWRLTKIARPFVFVVEIRIACRSNLIGWISALAVFSHKKIVPRLVMPVGWRWAFNWPVPIGAFQGQWNTSMTEQNIQQGNTSKYLKTRTSHPLHLGKGLRKWCCQIIVKFCPNASRVAGSREKTPKWVSFHIGRNIYASAYRFQSKLTGDKTRQHL